MTCLALQRTKSVFTPILQDCYVRKQTDLREIPWVPVPLLPQPLVIELDPESGWIAWDAAVRDLEADTPEARAHRLFHAARVKVLNRGK